MSNNIDQCCVAPTVLAGRTEGSKVRGFDIINLMTECGYEHEVYAVSEARRFPTWPTDLA